MNVTSSAPGKLYLAGEYAVTQAYQQALVFAVDRFLTVQVKTSRPDQAHFYSKNYQDQPLPTSRDEQGLFYIQNGGGDLTFSEHIIQVTEAYLAEKGHQAQSFQVEIHSDLDSPDGQKYGLGSSGALTIALVRGLFEYYGQDADDLTIFKLACLAHLRMGKRGSFGDLAAAAFTGCLLYTCFDKDQVLAWLKKDRLDQVCQKDWPGLSIQQIAWPSDFHLGIGWTGRPASTDAMLAQADQAHSDFSYEDFLATSNQIVDDLAQALISSEFHAAGKALQANRSVLQELSQARNLQIETPLLKDLIRLAHDHRAYAKSSGAGGGDCGLAIFDCKDCLAACHKDWQEAGIVPLDLKIYAQ